MTDPKTARQTVTLQIPPEYDGRPLEEFLRQQLNYSRRMLTRLKKAPENALRNGVHINLPDIVHAGDSIRLTVEETTYITPGKAGSVPIVYEDDDILIYNKPQNMPVHPSRCHQSDTLANVFTADMMARGQTVPFRVLNRLDRDTCGLCLCAKNAAAAHILSTQQQNGTLHKEYTAILCGRLPCKSGSIEAPIARPDPFYIDRVVRADGQYAKTAFRVIAQNKKYTAVCVNLYTGRTHQIRVHFASIGYPLAGDTLYGTDAAPLGHRLCCSKLSFRHPSTGENLIFSVPLPENWRDQLPLTDISFS